MHKSQFVLPFFKLLFTNPSVILRSLYHGVREDYLKKLVDRRFAMSNGLPELDLADLVPNMRQKVVSFTNLYGTSRPIDLALLRALTQRFQRCRYLEIGSWRGESLANVSPLCSECVSVSLSADQMRQRGFPAGFIEVERIFSRDLPNVTHFGADSLEFHFDSLGKFDLIFVDGDHMFGAVRSDTQKVFDLLRDDRSIIVWHDYAEHFELINVEVLGGILAGAPLHARPHLYHVTNTLCAIYVKGEFPSRPRVFPTMPNKVFEVEFTMTMLDGSPLNQARG